MASDFSRKAFLADTDSQQPLVAQNLPGVIAIEI
jgi:hypothetical protein